MHLCGVFFLWHTFDVWKKYTFQINQTTSKFYFFLTPMEYYIFRDKRLPFRQLKGDWQATQNWQNGKAIPPSHLSIAFSYNDQFTDWHMFNLCL